VPSSAPIADSARPAVPTEVKKKTNKGEFDYKPIHSAVRWNTASIEDIRALLNSPAAVNCPDPGNGNIPIHIAAQNGHTQIVKLLIELNAAINHQNQSGNTPLHMSIEYDYYETSKLLIEAGADEEILNQKNVPSKKGFLCLSPNKNDIIMIFLYRD